MGRDPSAYQKTPKPLPPPTEPFVAVVRVIDNDHLAYWGAELSIGDDDAGPTYAGVSDSAREKAGEPTWGKKRVDELWRDLMHLGYYSPSRSNHGEVKAGKFNMYVAGSVLALKHDLHFHFGIPMTDDLFACGEIDAALPPVCFGGSARADDGFAPPGPIYYRPLYNPKYAFGPLAEACRALWQPVNEGSKEPAPTPANPSALNHWNQTLAGLKNGGNAAGLTYNTLSVDDGDPKPVQRKEADIGALFAAMQADAKALRDFRERAGKKAPHNVSDAIKTLDKRIGEIADKKRALESDYNALVAGIDAMLARLDKAIGVARELPKKTKLDDKTAARLAAIERVLGAPPASTPRRRGVPYTLGGPDITELPPDVVKAVDRHMGEYANAIAAARARLDLGVKAFDDYDKTVVCWAIDRDGLDDLFNVAGRRAFSQMLNGTPEGQKALARVERQDYETDKEGHIQDPFAAFKLSGNVYIQKNQTAMQARIDQLRTRVLMLDDLCQRIDAHESALEYQRDLLDFSRIDRVTGWCIKVMRAARRLNGKAVFVLPTKEALVQDITGRSGKAYKLPLDKHPTYEEGTDIIGGVIDAMKADPKHDDLLPFGDVPAGILHYTHANESNFQTTFGGSQVGSDAKDAVVLYGIDWLNHGNNALFDPFETDPDGWAMSRGYGTSAITIFSVSTDTDIFVSNEGELATYGALSPQRGVKEGYLRGLCLEARGSIWVPTWMVSAAESLRAGIKLFCAGAKNASTAVAGPKGSSPPYSSVHDCTYAKKYKCDECLGRFKGTIAWDERAYPTFVKGSGEPLAFPKRPFVRLLSSKLDDAAWTGMGDDDPTAIALALKTHRLRSIQSYEVSSTMYSSAAFEGRAGTADERLEYPCIWLIARSHYAGGGWEAFNHFVRMIKREACKEACP